MNDKKKELSLLIPVALLLTVGFLLLSLFPAPRLSPTENRLLADTPQLTLSALADGSYTAGWDRFATERFPLRTPLRAARAAGLLLLGRREVGGVVLCRDGSLSRLPRINQTASEQNLAAVARLAARFEALSVPFTAATVPYRIEGRAEVLPVDIDLSEIATAREALLASKQDALTLSELTEDAHWYRTDHHWSSHGALLAYRQLAPHLGFTPFSDFEKEEICADFYGTADAAAGIPGVRPDCITLLRYEGDGAYRVRRDGQAAAFYGLYDTEKLSSRDKYAVFLGGNSALLTVDRGEEDQRPTLLVIRDSFADAMLPLLARHFRIVAVDPRYGVPADLSALSFDRVLLLCGMQTLLEGSFLLPLLK